MPAVARTVALAALLLACAGCSDLPIAGNDDAPTTAAFVAEAEKRCAPARTALTEKGFTVTGVPAPAQYQAFREAVRALRLAYVQMIEAPAPSGLNRTFDGYATAAIGVLDQLVEATRADERPDPDGRDLAIKRAGEQRPAVAKTGKDLGFTACALV